MWVKRNKMEIKELSQYCCGPEPSAGRVRRGNNRASNDSSSALSARSDHQVACRLIFVIGQTAPERLGTVCGGRSFQENVSWSRGIQLGRTITTDRQTRDQFNGTTEETQLIYFARCSTGNNHSNIVTINLQSTVGFPDMERPHQQAYSNNEQAADLRRCPHQFTNAND